MLIFLASVLSQEITALQILPAGRLLHPFRTTKILGGRNPPPDRLGLRSGLIGLDYAFFQIKSLTALEGVSPRSRGQDWVVFRSDSEFLFDASSGIRDCIWS